jgi:DNA-binding CsgD family transcriptional regulator
MAPSPSGRARRALTPREREVLQLAADGYATAEIGHALGITLGTTKTHFGRIYAKLGVGSRHAAVAEAIRQQVIR